MRQQKKRRTRTAIHEAAVTLAIERGLDNVTTDEISAAAGISARTFFNYFPSKISAVLGVTIEPFTEADRAHFLTSDTHLIIDLCDLLATLVSVPDDIERVRTFVSDRPELVEDLAQQLGRIRQNLTDATAERITNRHTAHLAVSLVVAAFGITIHSQTASATTSEFSLALQDTIAELGDLAQSIDSAHS